MTRRRARLAHRRTGAGPAAAAGATPMVLLHGGGGDGSTWDALVPSFAERRDVYVPDLRGMGRSERAGPYAMTVFRDDVLGLLDDAALDRVILVGHSLGGYVAMLVAQAAPDRVAALVLEECPPPVPLGLAVPDVPTSAAYYDREVRPSVLAELNAPDPARWAALSAMTMPTLVVAGGPASFLPQEIITRMAARLPAGHLLTIPHGHHVHTRAPDAFTAAVEAFLAAPPAPAPTARLP